MKARGTRLEAVPATEGRRASTLSSLPSNPSGPSGDGREFVQVASDEHCVGDAGRGVAAGAPGPGRGTLFLT